MSKSTFNLEYSIRNSGVIVGRIRKDDYYAQNWYAALCNNTFHPRDAWSILINLSWQSPSWGYSARMIAEIRENEAMFTKLYCSGVYEASIPGFVKESCITDEIAEHLKLIGWMRSSSDCSY